MFVVFIVEEKIVLRKRDHRKARLKFTCVHFEKGNDFLQIVLQSDQAKNELHVWNQITLSVEEKRRSHESLEKYPECKRRDDNFILWGCFNGNGKSYLFEIIRTINKEECHDLLKGNLKDYARYFFDKRRFAFQHENRCKLTRVQVKNWFKGDQQLFLVCYEFELEKTCSENLKLRIIQQNTNSY